MTISVTSVGGSSGIVSSSGIAYSIPDMTFGGSGQYGVGVACVDNSGSSGAAPTGTMTDSGGNTWTQRVAANYDPGAANAGVTVFIFTATMSIPLYYEDTITLSLSPNTTSKCVYFYRLTSSESAYMTYLGANNNTGSSTAAPTVTTSSIPYGGVVVCIGGAETNTAWTGDGDTSNGSWSSQQTQTASHGSGDLYSQALTTQYKVVTAAGTQTYNPTRAAAKDTLLAWVSYYENIPAARFDPMGRMGYYGI